MTKRLKYIIAIVALFVGLGVGELSAQHYVGIRGGYGNGNIRAYPQYVTSPVWGKYTGGVSWKWYNEVQIFGCIGVDAEYQQRGYKRYFGNNTDSTIYYQRDLQSIVVPFYWQPHLYFFKRHVRVFLTAGLNLQYNFGESNVYYGTDRGGVTTSERYTYDKLRDRRLGYGLLAGGGLGLLFGRLEFCFDARYYYGFSDLLTTRGKYSPNPVRTELDNLFINFGVYVRLGKGGIKAPPLNLNDPARKAAREADRHNFQDVKVIQM